MKAAGEVLTQLSRWTGYEKVRPPHHMTHEEHREATRKSAEDSQQYLMDLLNGAAT